MPELIVSKNDKIFFRVPLPQGIFAVGRSSKNDLTLPDEEISRRHAEIRWDGNSFLLKDCDSSLGTLVNSKKVDQTLLTDGSRIGIGPWILTFRELSLSVTEPEDEVKTRITSKDSSSLTSFRGLVGKSERMKDLFEKIQMAAPSDNTVLIQGETGSGKELVARSLHDLSLRKNSPYVVLNCGAISPNLIESELFGHEKGSFTGAIGRRLGAFEQANNGTLFLDEIGELPLELQPKLLRVLENHTLRRVGGENDVAVNVRVVAATNRILADEIKNGKFREDLFFRLYVIPLTIPPLRERSEDIPLLADYFLGLAKPATPKSFSAATMEKLRAHGWSGNVRELKNVVLRSLIFCGGDTIEPEHIQLIESQDKPPALQVNLAETEKAKIIEALKLTNGNRARAAQMLGIAKSTLFKKLKDYDIRE